ncbi:hypothetical protein PV08_10585 [Exophiala spinifera]|uniref:Uncharacterized protein n=1 Tax=Exophiala spinifera TaxID=91928 RepID=A0A0D2AXV9_9EURO|nr:uncharacterized protein PV08_10585 [Exophiala spinifera]KIW11285.1 hypothetical protein PV08_10585 [Exophiala spinifera]
MAPVQSKRSRPAFSPPRPGKSKSTHPPKGVNTGGIKKSNRTSNGGRVQKPASSRQPRQKKFSRGSAGIRRAYLEDEADEDDDPESDPEPEAIDRDKTEEEDNDDADDQEEDSGEDEGSDDNEEDDTREEDDERIQSSPEPDFILAEVTHDNPASDVFGPEPAIALPLVHRIMQSHFNQPEKTKLSEDARILVGKYIEIFVKEGIRRCVDEKQEREKSSGAGARVDSGWMELEDLERVATQLCMDF